MIYSNVDFNVVYVDPGITSAGDGTTPETAVKSLPATASELVDNTCYIVRRTAESASAFLPNGENTAITNLLIIGMPTVADRLYDLMPEEAKTAWGADAYDYANVQGEESLKLPNLITFVLHRVYLFRDNVDADCHLLNFYSNTAKMAVSFENCKFGSKGIDLDREDYRGELLDSRLKYYVSLNYVKMLSLKNCIINHAITGDYEAKAIYCYHADILHVENVRVFSALGRSDSDFVLYLTEDTRGYMQECIVSNLHHTLLFNGTNHMYVPPLMSIAMKALNARIQNVTIDMPGRGLSDTRPSNLYIENTLLNFCYFQEYKFTDITINIPYCWNVQAAVFKTTYLQALNNVPGIEKEFRNLTVNLGTVGQAFGGLAIGTPLSYSSVSSGGSNYMAVVIHCGDNADDIPTKVPIVDNVVIHHPRGCALYCNSVRLTNATIEGSVMFDNSFADITSLSTWFPGYVLKLSQNSHIQIGNLNVNLNNTTYQYDGDPAVTGDFYDGNNLFVGESNVPLWATEELSASEDYISCTCNNEGADGHFCHRSPVGVADTWSAYRINGAPASIKLSQKSSRTSPMILGRKPFHGIMLTPNTAGRHILKVHVAYKGFQMDEIGQNLIISISTQDAEGNTETYWSNIHGRWMDDSAAVWVNDTDLTQKCLEIPMDLTSVNPLDIRVYYYWKHATGFVYFDPAIELISTAQ